MDPLKITGCTRDVFNKWLERGYLRTRFDGTTQGVRRSYSKENLLELSFLSALTGAGLKLSDATPLVRRWIKAAPALYAYNPISHEGREYPDSNARIEALREDLPNDMGTGALIKEDAPVDFSLPNDFVAATSLNLIYPQDIIRRVDRFLAHQG